ncbi:MAG: carotenoid biosynthesis protein [Terracidiphilus sp.]
MSSILAAYLSARLLELVPTPFPRLAIVALDVLSALAFALAHGSRQVGWRGIAVFTLICTAVGNTVENVGVATGFPFGRYQFVELMGPKLLHVPVLLGLAYIGMAWVSWSVAWLIVAGSRGRLAGRRLFALPFAAAFVMTAWDLAQDPVWATLLHGWTWRDGGPWFGVPVSNFLGWYGTVLLIYLLFALWLSRRAEGDAAPPGSPAPALLFYALCAGMNILQVVPRTVPQVVQDPAGRVWHSGEITAASAMVSFFVMGAFAVFAWIRLADGKDARPE